MFTVRNVGDRLVEIVITKAIINGLPYREITPIMPRQEIKAAKFILQPGTVLVGRDGDRIDVRAA